LQLSPGLQYTALSAECRGLFGPRPQHLKQGPRRSPRSARAAAGMGSNWGTASPAGILRYGVSAGRNAAGTQGARRDHSKSQPDRAPWSLRLLPKRIRRPKLRSVLQGIGAERRGRADVIL